MCQEDIYYNISKAGEGQYREKMSRFLAFAFHASTSDEAREIVKRISNEYHDARHVCWAYVVGADGTEWQLNDNGEPSGTAGKPILGQIRSYGLTDTVVAVVRYFGGIKLGTSGLISAYREAARLALEDAGREICYKKRELSIAVGYERVDKVLKQCGGGNVEIVEREFDNLCRLLVRVRESESEAFKRALSKIEGVEIQEK